MFFRRVFAKNQHDYSGKEMFEDSSDHQSPPSPPMKMHKRRASIEEKQSRGLSVLQLTPLWEHIIRTNSMPRSINLVDVFDEFYERLHDPEWQVRQHALRVLVDVLIVMGQQADYHIQNLIHPLVDNLGHIAPAVRKGALDALRVYVAQTAMPETVMLDIMNYGMERPANDPFGGRMTVAVMLALPALILPILITPKRGYVVKAVIDALSNKMVKITYQEIALKILLKIRDMIGQTEFTEHIPMNVKKDFDLLCKVYGLPKSAGYHDANVDLHVPAHDTSKPWASKFVPKKDIQGNIPSSHAPINAQNAPMSATQAQAQMNASDGSKYFGNNYDSTYPFERTRLSNNLGTPKRNPSPRAASGGILRSSSENSLSLDCNGNSSGSESGASSMSFQTQNNTEANSKFVPLESASSLSSPEKAFVANGGCGGNGCEKSAINGKVIMETEIKINPETAVTMRILEQNPSTQTDDSEDESTGAKRIITDFSAPYPVTPMREKNRDDNNNSLRSHLDASMPKNGRRVHFGGEIVKMRTPDSDTVDQSDDNETTEPHTNLPLPDLPLHKQNSNLSDNSSVSSDNSNANEYIKQTNVGFMNDSFSQMRSNIEKKIESSIRKSSAMNNNEPYNYQQGLQSGARQSMPDPREFQQDPRELHSASRQVIDQRLIPTTSREFQSDSRSGQQASREFQSDPRAVQPASREFQSDPRSGQPASREFQSDPRSGQSASRQVVADQRSIPSGSREFQADPRAMQSASRDYPPASQDYHQGSGQVASLTRQAQSALRQAPSAISQVPSNAAGRQVQPDPREFPSDQRQVPTATRESSRQVVPDQRQVAADPRDAPKSSRQVQQDQRQVPMASREYQQPSGQLHSPSRQNPAVTRQAAPSAMRQAPPVSAMKPAPATSAMRQIPPGSVMRQASAISPTRQGSAVSPIRQPAAVSPTRRAPGTSAMRQAPGTSAMRQAPVEQAIRQAPPTSREYQPDPRELQLAPRQIVPDLRDFPASSRQAIPDQRMVSADLRDFPQAAREFQQALGQVESPARENPPSAMRQAPAVSAMRQMPQDSRDFQSAMREAPPTARPTTASSRSSKSVTFPLPPPPSFTAAAVAPPTRPMSSGRPALVHSPPTTSNGSQPNSKDSSPPTNGRYDMHQSSTPPSTLRRQSSKERIASQANSKDSSPSSTDYSQELTIGIPDVETILPAHFTPPNIMIKKTMPASGFNQNRPGTMPGSSLSHYQPETMLRSSYGHNRPATSPMMISPRIVTIAPTSSSSHSSRSPTKSAPSTPNLYVQNRSSSPDRNLIRRSVSSLSPRASHRGVTMMHNLQRSPSTSPGRIRRMSISSLSDHGDRPRSVGATQTSYEQFSSRTPRLDETTQTSYHVRIDEITQTSQEAKRGDTPNQLNDDESSPDSAVIDSPVTQYKQIKSWEELGIVDYYTLKDLRSGDFRLRSRAICAIEDALKVSDNLALVQPYLDSLLRSLLSSERHPDVIEDQRRVLSNLISRLPLENLEDRVTQIVTGLCRQGGAASNIVAKNLMQRLPTAAIVLKLLSDDFLQVRSSKFRENSLQMVIFALLTFPSTYFDVVNCVERTAKAALDRKKRVRQAALDVLAVLGQISSPKTVVDVVSHIAEFRKDGMMLLAATKARLARKQLPLVATDGEVHYALKIPSASNTGSVIMFGSDIEYICSGSGSVSPTSLKNRSFLPQPTGMLGQESGRMFEERRMADGMNRYAGGGGGVGTPTKSSPWSRIPIKSSSGSDDDHGFVVGIAHQSLQRPLESTGRFYGKLQSRSFPELSDATKEKPPVRQLSDNQTMKLKQAKQPVASTRFPAVETNVKSNSKPYSFAPLGKQKQHQRLPQSSDGVTGESIGSLHAQSSQLDIRPRTHPPTDMQQSAQGMKHKQNVDQTENIQKKNSAKSNGNELTIQQFTSTIGLIESDDAKSEAEVVTTQPTSAKSKKSEEVSNKDLVENYVDDQMRRTSGKTNSHILSDNDNNPNSIGSTPLHLSKEPTASEIANVRNEIAHIQSVIESVKLEMVEMQKKAASPAKGKSPTRSPSRPQSVNSNHSFVREKVKSPVRSKTSMDFVKSDELKVTPMKSKTNPSTPKATKKSNLKAPASPKRRIPTPTHDDLVTDDCSSNAAGEETDDAQIETSQGLDEVDEHPHEMYDPTTDSGATMSKEIEIDDDDATIDAENADYQQVFSPTPTPEHAVTITIETTTTKVKRQPPLKRGVRMIPIKNPMPNIQQPSTVPPQIVVSQFKVHNSLFPANLKRFERPKDSMYHCLQLLDSPGWEEVMEGLKAFVRLIRHHPEYVDSQIHLFSIALAKHVKNLRSQVSRAACSAASEFFMTNSKNLDADAEELAAALLNRTADTNKFLRGDALRALESMCDALHPTKVILILTFRGASHQNAAVRCTTAQLLNQVVFRIGCDKVFNLHKDIRDRLIITGANLLMEGSLETRNYTKQIFKQLSIHSHYQKLLLDVIPANVYRNIEKSLKSIS